VNCDYDKPGMIILWKNDLSSSSSWSSEHYLLWCQRQTKSNLHPAVAAFFIVLAFFLIPNTFDTFFAFAVCRRRLRLPSYPLFLKLEHFSIR
jgi:hypothetical protein